MQKTIALVNGAPHSVNVCDYAAWAAQRLSAPLELLHVLDRHPERAPVTDYSGSIGLGAQETLLDELTDLDEKRSTLAQHYGRELLGSLVQRAKETGLERVESRLRHGSLLEAVVDLEPESRLFVVGQTPAQAGAKAHLDPHIEQVIRALHRAVLVASTAYRQPRSFALAIDGSATSRKMVETVAQSPLLRGLAGHLVMAGDASEASRKEFDWAQEHLRSAGFEISSSIKPGHPESVLPTYLKTHNVDLLVMGAYGHSRIRQFIVGSTTTTLLRTSPVPVLVLR